MLSEKKDETTRALISIQPKLPNLDEAALPEAVYHYTDASGLLGILDTGVLWATDYRYLNDSSELRYIFDLATGLVEERLRSDEHGPLARQFLEYVSTTPAPYADVTYYLCCFSESDNLLSQWRAYGGRQGFCLSFPGDITFNPTLVEVPAQQGQSAGITLLKVEYRVERHTAYVTKLIQELIDLCEGSHMNSYSDSMEAIANITPFYFGQLERASYRFKHPDFADEREWRLVSWGERAEFFRASVTLTPYTKFSIFSASHPSERAQGLPLLAVGHGPTSLPQETKLAVDRLLRSRGYSTDYCERRGSNTPVRL